MIGAYLNDELVGYVGVHEDGCMGLLEVFPKYRNLGLGKLLSIAIIKSQRDKGLIPYGYVVNTNDKAISLYTKIGFTIEEKGKYWVFYNSKPE